MRLKKLEIYGFKSFAERTEIFFEQGTTGIVGPNGSGKSNISDAVRWVLGEQSAKQLRGAKMEDIIFNGTEKRKPLAWCEVSLMFDNSDGSLPMDCAELEVTRRVYRNGTSEYYLNRASCRLKDITDLFRDTGIGKEGYSLIGQGRIDEILSVKSEDRRNIFEEAAGIVKYKARKLEAEHRMENTRQNLLRVEDILQEMETQLGPLEEQSRVARRYLTLQEALRSLELNAFLVQYDRFQTRMAEAEALLRGLEGSLQEAEQRLAEARARRVSQEETVQGLEDRARQARQDVLEATRALQSLQGENGVLRERIQNEQAQAKRLTEALAAAEEKRAANLLAARQQAERGDLDTQALDKARAELETAERGLEAALGRENAAEQALEEHKAALIAAMNRLSDMRQTQARLTTMRQTLEARLEETGKALAEHTARRGSLEEGVAAAEASGKEVAARLERLAADAAVSEQHIRDTATETEALNERGQAQSAKLHETSSRLRMLQEMARDYEGYQHAVKQVLLRGRQEPGVCGVVASLMQVPADYERAVEMVLGGALQNVVTEDEHVAKRMIEYLRSNRYGRATFLPLTTIRGRTLTPQERQALNVPGCLGVASELVGFDERYRDVVENLLGRTVIAENLDVGIEVMRRGRHAFRLVTLQGDVMHSGGSMTGGSVQSRMTSLLSRNREIEEHQEALEGIKKAQEQTRRRLEELEQVRAEGKRERGELYARVHQEEIAAAREQERLSNAKAALEAHLRQTGALESQLEQMRSTLEDIAGQLAQSGQNEDSAQVDQSAMQRRTLALQEALAHARQEAEQARERVTGCKVALAAQEREDEAQRRELNRLRAEQRTLDADIASLRAQLEESERRCGESQARFVRGEADHSAQEAELAARQKLQADLEAERTAAQEALRETRALEERLQSQIQEETERRHRAEVQFARLEGDCKALQDRIWNTYELTYAGALEWKQEDFSLSDAEKEITAYRQEIRSLGAVNVHAVEEYQALRERYDQMVMQRDDLTAAAEDLQGIIDELLVKMERRFREQFKLLNEYFGQTFTALFGGGTASLSLADERNVLECGIEVVAQPPGKKLQLLSLLSGGERALTAIAILFAMLRLKPTPFCILDEIEAALDEANVANFANFLAEYAKSTQFVVVTHRKGTMERCQALYGVAMAERGVSRMVSVRLEEALA